MKYLKKYESSNIPNFKEGDYVICIDNQGSILTKEMKYLVKKIFIRPDDDYYGCCKVTSKLGKIGENLGTFSCRRFVSEEEYKEILFQNDIKNFNL